MTNSIHVTVMTLTFTLRSLVETYEILGLIEMCLCLIIAYSYSPREHVMYDTGFMLKCIDLKKSKKSDQKTQELFYIFFAPCRMSAVLHWHPSYTWIRPTNASSLTKCSPTGWLSGERVDPQLRRTFFPAYFRV